MNDTAAAAHSGVVVSVRGSVVDVRFEQHLPPLEQRGTIQRALNETFSADVRVRFEIAPDLVSGIELVANEQKVGWNISAYLASLEKGVAHLLTEAANPRGASLAEQVRIRGHRGRRCDSARAHPRISLRLALLATLHGPFYRLRQDGIDEELFDVVSGFEALSKERRRADPLSAHGEFEDHPRSHLAASEALEDLVDVRQRP
jgi:hypothetical protein